MIRTKLFAFLVVLVFLAACKSSIKPELLYGKWKYIKLESTDVRSTRTVTPQELESESPYIQFSKNDSLLIWWGGKILSHGSYKLEGENIQYKEILDSGKTREFPFIVSKLDDKNIVFETTGDDASKVTAVREN